MSQHLPPLQHCVALLGLGETPDWALWDALDESDQEFCLNVLLKINHMPTLLKYTEQIKDRKTFVFQLYCEDYTFPSNMTQEEWEYLGVICEHGGVTKENLAAIVFKSAGKTGKKDMLEWGKQFAQHHNIEMPLLRSFVWAALEESPHNDMRLEIVCMLKKELGIKLGTIKKHCPNAYQLYERHMLEGVANKNVLPKKTKVM